MTLRIALPLLLTAVLAIPACATVIGNFDGLDKMIDRADAIAIVRIDDSPPAPDIVIGLKSQTYKCYVYQSLKGAVPVGKVVPLHLMDTSFSFTERFRLYSTHLVFLAKRTEAKDGAQYASLGWQGANLELSPFGNETLPKTKSVKATIQYFVKQYQVYRDAQAKKEDAFLAKVLGS